jgi:hypothetical protein
VEKGLTFIMSSATHGSSGEAIQSILQLPLKELRRSNHFNSIEIYSLLSGAGNEK